MYLYAILAYPEQNKEEDKNRLLFALQSWCSKAYARRFGKANTNPILLKRPNQQVYNQIDQGWNRMQKRLLAAELAERVFLRWGRYCNPASHLVVTDRLPTGESSLDRLQIIIGSNAGHIAEPALVPSVTSVIRDHAESIIHARGRRSHSKPLDDPNFVIEDEISNIFSRIWTPSKPVLHLAIAFRSETLRSFPGDGKRRKLLSMLANPDWIQGCLKNAEIHRTLVIPASPLAFPSKEMIQVLPERS
jgi:hypothetical protein